MDGRQDRGAEERPGGHAQERQRSDEPERPCPRRTVEQVGGGGRPDRDEDATTDRLDEARRDELVEILGHAGEGAADREDHEPGEEQASRAPHVGQPAGERHHEDVHEQVAVDDPARLAQLDPGRNTVRVDEVRQDRRQGDRRDHELEPGEEHPDAEHDEQHERRAAIHAGECIGGP